MTPNFDPTPQQKAIIDWNGSAFVTACPGAGKTRVIVERARQLLRSSTRSRGLAVLSFTESAISELQHRLHSQRLLLPPVLPSFVGTFDSFLWRFFVAPLGIPGVTAKPRLIPDLSDREVTPYTNAQPLPLSAFHRATGEPDPEVLQRLNFTGDVGRHRSAAEAIRKLQRQRGELDHADARSVALHHLRDLRLAATLAAVVEARFSELIVDEAQDCNPEDLEIIQWFRTIGVPVKVICDPDQAIYGFRGGVTDELAQFAETFLEHERFLLSGNFRSTPLIVNAVRRLRRTDRDGPRDEARGEYREEKHPVHLLFYPGKSVPSTISERFRELVASIGAAPEDCPLVAATRRSASGAAGTARDPESRHLTIRLAMATTAFHAAFDRGGRTLAVNDLHAVILAIRGELANATYLQRIAETEAEGTTWRSDVIAVAQQLRYGAADTSSTETWLAKARTLLAPTLTQAYPRSIAQILRSSQKLADVLTEPPRHGLPARTIHSVKGAEFPAVCVVLSPQTTKSTLDYLESSTPANFAEELRKFYVGASRAQRLLTIAVPNSQGQRLKRILLTDGDSRTVTTEQL